MVLEKGEGLRRTFVEAVSTSVENFCAPSFPGIGRFVQCCTLTSRAPSWTGPSLTFCGDFAASWVAHNGGLVLLATLA